MKIIKIKSCSECPYFVGFSISNNLKYCNALSLYIKVKYTKNIYKDCPLNDYEKTS